jgi:RNA polymerase sigma factor (sigma-70 family)
VATALIGPADAEDAAQEALLRGMRSWGTLRDVGALHTWLLRITYNVCTDWRRGRFGTERRLTQPLPADDEELALAPLGEGPGSSDHAAALDLRAAISRLDAGMRVVVALRYYANVDATDIGAMLHLPASTVRTRLRRALALLRADLSLTREVAPPQEKHEQRNETRKGDGDVDAAQVESAH